jgi:hypothetical protein
VERRNLPPDPTPFVGRAAELADIAAALADPDCRLLLVLMVRQAHHDGLPKEP